MCQLYEHFYIFSLGNVEKERKKNGDDNFSFFFCFQYMLQLLKAYSMLMDTRFAEENARGMWTIIFRQLQQQQQQKSKFFDQKIDVSIGCRRKYG